MTSPRALSLLLAGLVILVVVAACGLGFERPSAIETTLVAPEAPAQPSPSLDILFTPTPPIIPLELLPTAASVPQPAIPETRRLTLEFPPVMRAGDSTRIRLQLEVDKEGNLTPTAIVEGNVVVGETVSIPNLYDTHRVMAEARLDLAGMEVKPSAPISESLQPGLPVTFYWSVHPETAGVYQGTAWLHLRFIPLASGEESRIPLSVQFLDIEVRSLWGLSGGAARGLGAIGSTIGAVLGFPFVDDLLKWLWRKRRRNP